MRWSKAYLASIYARKPSSKKSCRSAADLYKQLINKVTCTKDSVFECIIALCFIHGFKPLWVNGFRTGLCSKASFMGQITKNHATLMKMLAGYDNNSLFVFQMRQVDNAVCPSGFPYEQ